MNIHGGPLNVYCQLNKAKQKGHTVQQSNAMTFWGKANYADSKRSLVSRGSRRSIRSADGLQIFMEVKLFSSDIAMTDTCHYTLVQTSRTLMYSGL